MIFSTIKKKLIVTQALYLSMLVGFLVLGSSAGAQAPANDNPCQAIELTPAATCTYQTFTNQSATTSTGMAAPGCANFTAGTSADVWFKAVVPANGALTFEMQRGTMTDGGMAVYRGNTCSLLSRIACDDNSSTNTNMPKLTVTGQTPGSTVYVRVWAANNVNGTFGICATIPVPPPANDEPCTAIELRPNATCDFREFTNEAATNSPNILDPGCGGYLGGDVWFKVVVPAGGAIIVRTQAGVMLDGGMALYTGSACNASLSLLGCNDNTSTTNLMPSFTAGGLTPGDTVWIRMYENGNNNNGTFSICVTLPPPPPSNDGECAAIELPVNETCTFQQFTNADATASGLIPAPGCGNYLGGDVWFKFVVPAGGAVSINTQAGVMTDGAMALYSGNCRALTLITCATAGAGGNMPRIVAGGLTPGDTLWVRMWEEGNNNNGTFSICVSVPPPPPSNDAQCSAIELPVNATCVFQQFTNTDATASSGAPAPGCGNYQGGDVWFKFVVPAGGAVTIGTQAGVMTDGAMALYRGNCNALTLVTCATTGAGGNMPRINAGGLNAGDTLWVRMWEEGNDNNGTFSICVSIPVGLPANDDPCSAVELTPSTTCTYQTFSNENATGSLGVPEPGCANYQGGDVWFKVVVPSGGALNFDTQTDVITDAGMAIYSGSCGALTLIECDDDDSQNGAMSFISAGGLNPGDTIWVRVWEYGGDNNGTFGICVRIPPPPPAYDNPCQAVTLPVNPTCTSQTFTNENATGTTGVPAPGCGGYSGGDVWFNVVVPAGGAVTIGTQAAVMTDGAIAVYSGSCTNLTLINCNDNGAGMPSITVGGRTPGDTLWVRVWENGNNNNGTFGICAFIPPPPPTNDDPCTAIELPVSTTCNFQTFTNENSTTTTGVPAPGCANFQGTDVWFKVVVPAGGALIFDSQTGVILDGGMAIYRGTCGNLTLIECDDDDSQNGAMSFISRNDFTPGDTIWIRMWEYGGDNNGTFGICVKTPPPPPANDNPCQAVTLPVNATCSFQTFTNESATNTAGVPAPGCANYLGGDVWFNAVVPASGTIQVSTQAATVLNGGMALYSGSCGALTLISCNDDGTGNGLMPKITAGGLNPGDTIWIRVWENGNDNNGTFGICATIPPPPPANDDPCNAIELTPTTTCTYQTFTTSNATASSNVPAPGCANYLGGDVWFKVVVPAGGSLKFDTQTGGTGNILDGGMAIYKGTCGQLRLLECDDDDSPNGAMPLIDGGGLNPGDTIWIRVWERGNDIAGNFGICVTIPPAGPANDHPCNAITLTPSNTCTYQTFTNAGAYATTGVPAPGCAGYLGGDVWFQVVVPAQGGIIVDTREGAITDGGMALYSGRCDSMVLVSCDDNNSVNGDMPTIYATGLTPGTIAWLRVWENGNNNNGTFGICVTIPPPQPATISLNCAKDTTIDCGTCFSLNTTIPNIHNATDRYVVNKLNGPGNCFRPYVATGDVGPSTNLGTDDLYTGVIALPFSFPFYGQNYNALVASTNGYLSFDLTEAGQFSHYSILNNNGALSATAGTGQNLPSNLYDRALVMGPYHDINPFTTTSPTRKIKYNVTGIAPNRRWILSFNKVPMFDCDNQINNSHQIVLYEGSGMIEVFVFEKEICTTWNDGRAMIGLQNFDRNQGIMAPGRRASDPRWGGNNLNESWRFTPVAGRTLYKRVELYDTLGNLMAVGDTSSIDEANLSVRFNRVCPSVQTIGVTPYIVKTFYEKFDDPNGEVVSTDTINVRRNSVLNARYDITDPSCTAANGAIAVHAVGTPPYRFSIDSGATYLSDSNFVNLAAGSYNVTISDGAGCRRDTTIELIPQSRLTATYTTTPVLCNGGATGTLQLHVIAGTAAPYTFSVDGGTSFQSDSLFNLAAGTYAVRILDGNNCSKDTTITITQPTAITATVNVTAATCAVAATAVIHVQGGTPGYLFSIDATNFGADSLFNLVAGTNVLTIKDANGCLKDTSITVASPSAISLAATVVPVTCNGGNNGVITITATNTTNPVSYSINGSPFGSASTFTNLAAGSYRIIVNDGSGCTKDTTVEVTQPAALTATYVIDQALCGRNGNVVVTASAGTPDYLYASTGTYGASNSFSLPVGTYTISVKDANGCTKDTSVQIIATGAVNATYTITNVSCNGGNDGSIVVNANGTAPYQYSVSTGAAVYGTSETFSNLPVGSYNVSVLDANGCSKDTVITITEPTAVTGTYAITNVTCNGGNNGVIVVAAAGGTPGYTYSTDGTSFVASGSFTGLAQGSYTVRMRDAKGCTKDTTIAVTQPAAISFSAVVNAVSCNGGANGSFTVTASGGTGVYEYSSNGGTSYQPGNSFGNLVAGTYQLRVRDANGCTKDSVIEIVQPAALTLTNVVSNATCSPISNGQVTVTANGGTGTYIYSQDNFATTSATNQFAGLAQGNYTISVRDANGCIATTNAVVGFTFDLTLSGRADTSICDDAGVVLYTNSNAQSFSWTPAAGLSNATIASPVATPTATTTYVLTVQTGTCELKDTVTVTVSAPPVVFAGNDVEVIKGGDASIFANVDNAVSYVWSPATYLNNPNSLSPIAVMPQQTTTYRLTATNSLGCSSYDEVKVTVIPYCIKPKNAFSPNGDGINDTWSVYDQYECLQNVRVRVFNRYGSKVFESSNYRNDWKGTFGGSPLPDATYYYVIDYTLFNGQPFQVRGDVTILR